MNLEDEKEKLKGQLEDAIVRIDVAKGEIRILKDKLKKLDKAIEQVKKALE
jgi:chromosome segregation ATPase